MTVQIHPAIPDKSHKGQTKLLRYLQTQASRGSAGSEDWNLMHYCLGYHLRAKSATDHQKGM